MSTDNPVLGDLRGCWIVVADDVRALRFCVVELLAATDAVCVEVANGNALAELLATRSVDVVITDVRMPGRSGIDVLRERRALGDPTPFILITGSPDPKLLRNLAGATFLAKPFTREALHQAVGDAIRYAHGTIPKTRGS